MKATSFQEFDDAVLMQHVDLYVNDCTVDLGDTGRLALDQLCERARTIGLLPPEYIERSKTQDGTDAQLLRARVVADYIAGMTDRYAISVHARLFDPHVSA